MMKNERDRIAEVIGADRATTAGKAAVMRVLIGAIDPDDGQNVICACGWSGIIADCDMERYRSDEESWSHLAGRAGWVWRCPECDEIVWKYYTVIN